MSDSLVTAIYSWFTPTVLFIFLNLIIGTIAITSSLSSSSSKSSDHQSQIQRSPSVIHRLKSINFSSFTSPPDKTHLQFPPVPTTPDEPPASIEQNQPFLSRSPSVLHRIKSFNLYNYISQEPITVAESPPPAPASVPAVEEEEEETGPSLEEVYSKLNLNHVARTKSDTEPAAGALPPKLPKKMKKSASTKSPFSHFEEAEDAVEARRPETVRVTRVTPVEEAADEQVDAKADDFINRFKHQLKLQRIDSITKYKEMVKKRNDK